MFFLFNHFNIWFYITPSARVAEWPFGLNLMRLMFMMSTNLGWFWQGVGFQRERHQTESGGNRWRGEVGDWWWWGEMWPMVIDLFKVMVYTWSNIAGDCKPKYNTCVNIKHVWNMLPRAIDLNILKGFFQSFGHYSFRYSRDVMGIFIWGNLKSFPALDENINWSMILDGPFSKERREQIQNDHKCEICSTSALDGIQHWILNRYYL